MATLAGKSGSISIGGNAFALSDWSIDMATEIVDTTVFTSGGAKENIAGLLSGKISASGPFNSTAMAIVSGTSYAFVLTMASGVAITVTARVSNINVKTDVKDAVRVNITAESNGSFTASLA